MDTETSESAVTSDDEDGVAAIDEQTLPNDQFVVFREHTLRMEKVMSIQA